MVPAVTVKVALLAAAATVTEAGVVSSVLLSDSATEVAPVAVLERVTVQVLLAEEPRLVGVQASEVKRTGAIRLMLAVWEPPS